MTYELRHPMGHIPIIHVTRMILTGWKRLIGCLKSQNDLYMTHIRIIPPSCHIRIIHVTYTRWRLITGCLICIRHFPQKSPIIFRKRAQKSLQDALSVYVIFRKRALYELVMTLWHMHESSLRHVYTNGSCLSSSISLTNKSQSDWSRIIPPSCIYESRMPLIIHINYEWVAEWLVFDTYTNHPSVMYTRRVRASHHPYHSRTSQVSISSVWQIARQTQMFQYCVIDISIW